MTGQTPNSFPARPALLSRHSQASFLNTGQGIRLSARAAQLTPHACDDAAPGFAGRPPPRNSPSLRIRAAPVSWVGAYR